MEMQGSVWSVRQEEPLRDEVIKEDTVSPPSLRSVVSAGCVHVALLPYFLYRERKGTKFAWKNLFAVSRVDQSTAAMRRRNECVRNTAGTHVAAWTTEKTAAHEDSSSSNTLITQHVDYQILDSSKTVGGRTIELQYMTFSLHRHYTN